MDWQVPGYDELRELGGDTRGRVVLASERNGGGLRVIRYVNRAADSLPREAAALERVDDPHVARIHGYVPEPDGEGGALITEAVRGYGLGELLASRVALEPTAALAALKGSLLGLAAAHAAGAVHRDVKPANVMVRPDGTTGLVGFGGAVPEEDGGREGTPAYLAPEQWTGAPATSVTDLYAVTCVFFECLTGAPPYLADTEAELQQLHQNASPPIERVPEALRPLVLRGLAKFPAQRPLDALTFAADLEKAARRAYGRKWEKRGRASLTGLVAAMADTGAHPVVAHVPRRGGIFRSRAALLCGVVGLTAIVAGGTAVYSAGGDRRQERPAAVPEAARSTPALVEVLLVEENTPVGQVVVATVKGLPEPLGRKANASLRARVDTLLQESRPNLAGTGDRIRVRASLGIQSAGLVSVRYTFSAGPGNADGGQGRDSRFAVTVDLTTGEEITPSRIFPETALPELNRRIMKVSRDPAGCFESEPLRLTGANLENVLDPAFARKGMRATLHLAESGPDCREIEELVPYRMLLDLMAPEFRAKLGR
ncbi:serine/threonine-protein kinase [Actinocorallia sp. B10E7]|uniref:serine/threonine-protein kinase n=1 Tax=Actinocorallia sp. B10E7 TaxID=3153558 RepID=UPI00325C9904